jgi:Asp-tRNA(Asn)/Glu-tRNA(Gln) amidotransferase A subunit family amidase
MELSLIPKVRATVGFAVLLGMLAIWRTRGEDQAAPFLSRNTFPASGAGLPAVTVPMGLSVEKLPVGFEIGAAPGADRSLLSLAGRIEMAIGSILAPAGFD